MATLRRHTVNIMYKEDRDNIATLVNNIMVDEMMQTAFREKGNRERARYWAHQGYKHTVELAETYGIELPTLKMARQFIPAEEA